ncbi:hypothetical protein A3B32_00735 [Candidatus Uhrbacteria bacterium RIFCSPLOWO2_01_FULL_53_9]|uniref:Uncharacterized protein n=3 Tax=Candidatus Uhriibacteriota TaxID=1752732 RepID=A0A1F7UXI9_9BACT|nr:MAG: hypothetical protein A3C17_00180 [Candidatus Uhrbacteria bacterium RIFCSPHIGHO2_02_FULL_53_13]OGL82966.1 MAG: hypothetical protein A3B32_00735 [Candidatus Uhrbacteria bacterium RIFCSPLOWO2_01_FULL_53_9]OGL89667.1 MAG: hypothetical protein A3I45_01795 [Candidatus Uhrbacteria bacterium RIFCSPLOWO2_02_FULL_53_10]
MNIILLILISVAAWYLIFLAVKSRRAKPFPCAYCLATVATWIVGLALTAVNVIHAPLLLAILMGQSSLGFFFKLKERAPRTLSVIQLPYFFTATLLTFAVLNGWSADLVAPSILTFATWPIALLVLAYQSHPTTRRLVDRLVACCKQL